MARYQVEVLFEVEIDGTEQIAQEMVDRLLDLLVTPHLRPNVHWEIFPGSTRVLDELAGFIPTQKEDSYDPPRWGQQPNEPIVPIFNNNADPDDIPEDDGDEVAIDPRDLGPIDPDEIFTPMMGWQSCRYIYEAPGDDGMDDYYRCIVHDTITIGHDVSCEGAADENTIKWERAYGDDDRDQQGTIAGWVNYFQIGPEGGGLWSAIYVMPNAGEDVTLGRDYGSEAAAKFACIKHAEEVYDK